jgi:hypothetical protein
MKKIFLILIIVSVLILCWSGLSLFNVYISLKYEIEEPLAMSKESTISVKEKELYINDTIFWLWTVITIELLNIATFLIVFIKQKKG